VSGLNVSICDGKYTVIQESTGGTRVLRYGEEWRDVTGDNVICGLAWELQESRDRIKRLEKSSQQLKSLNNKICEINLKVSQERHDSNVRIKQLEQENDALRADLLLWDKAGIGFTTEDKP
jgi:hypothetical protein